MLQNQKKIIYKIVATIAKHITDPRKTSKDGTTFSYDFGNIGFEEIGEKQIYVSGPCEFNPHHEYAKSEMEQWISKYDFFNAQDSLGSDVDETILKNRKRRDKFLLGNYAALMAYVYPEIGPKELAITTFLGVWLFVHDDSRDAPDADNESIPEMNRLLKKVINGQSFPALSKEDQNFKIVESLKDLLQHCEKYGDNTYFKEELKSYLDTNLWEAKNRTEKRFPSLLDYIRNRRFTSAVGAAFEIGFLMRNISISPEQRRTSKFIRSVESGCQSVCFINDIVSLKKEIQEGHGENLVTVVKYQDAKPLTWSEAIDHVHERYYKEEVKAFKEIQQELKESESVEDTKYLDTIESWINGSTYWSLPNMLWGTSRYAAWGKKTVIPDFSGWKTK